jgi:SNF2 family DNA or RNA helicase
VIELCISPTGTKLLLRAPVRYKDLVNQIPGMSYNGPLDAWVGPLSWGVALACRGILGDALTLSPEVNRWGEQMLDEIRSAYDIKNGKLKGAFHHGRSHNLYPFQEIGTLFLAFREKVLMADEMGTGKTVQAAVALTTLEDLSKHGRNPSPFPCLVVCTYSMKRTWVDEITKWTPWQAVHTGSTKGTREKAYQKIVDGHADIIVCHWQEARLVSRLAGYGSMPLSDKEKEPGLFNGTRWATVIADEAHKAKDPKAKQTRALWWLGREADYRWALTGTPIANKAEDLWTVMHFVDPDNWPSRTKWINRYALHGFNVHGGLETYGYNPHTEQELQAFWRPQFIRRTKLEVLKDLPPKVRRTIWCEMKPPQAKAYKQMAEHMMASVYGGGTADPVGGAAILMAPNAAVQSARLGQLASAVPVMDGDKVIELSDPSCKIDALLDLLDESDEPMVVGAESRKLIELAARTLDKNKISYVLITGLVDADARAAAVKKFQEGGARVCLVTLGAGAEGITLTRARIIVFLQVSFSQVANTQFEDRIHRIGQDADTVEVITILTRDTTDVARWIVANDKEGIAQQAYKDPHWVRKMLTGI